MASSQAQTGALGAFRLRRAPYYRAVADEETLFRAAHALRMPMMLKGPTGCGKTRFVEHMAWQLGLPLITVACNEDMSASDLLGRHVLDGQGTHWQDGPLTYAARHGAICYLDEVVEARQDTLVAIHPLTDSRRLLPLAKNNEVLEAHAAFYLVVSHNPGYQSALKDLKPSTKQRFAALAFDYPARAVEAEIIAHESGVSAELADKLVSVAECARNLKEQGLEEGISTRMLVHAGKLMQNGIAAGAACRVALVQPLTDDADLSDALLASVEACFGGELGSPA